MIELAIANSIQDQHMDYEEMLELGERIGVVRRGFVESDIQKIKWEVAGPEIEEEEVKCAICVEKLANEDMFLKLGCQHPYHKECIEVWFMRERKCPVCVKEVELKDII